MHAATPLRPALALLAAGLAGGAGFGFVARDLIDLAPPGVTAAWVIGALAGAGARRRPRTGEEGQATVEWVGLVLFAALTLGALVAAGPRIDGRSFGGFLAHHIVCAVKSGCRDGDTALARAYGERDGALARALAPGLVYERGEPTLPVDWRRCRSRGCADAADEPDLDAHRSAAGERATAFVRRVRRGGRTYFLYWLYYPYSNTVLGPSDSAWNHSPLKLLGRYPGYHDDDWEAYAARVDRDGQVYVRASSHGHWQGCKQSGCHNRWTAGTGWTRISRGSHAGHIPLESRDGRRQPSYPGLDLGERTTTPEGLRLVPLEGIQRARRRYRALDPSIRPPWRKRAWHDPESEDS